MTTDIMDGERPGLIARARGILLRPRGEWQRIAGEEPTPLIGAYIAPLAVAGAIVSVAAHAVYSGFKLDADLAWSAIAGALYVAFAILGVLVAAWLISFLGKRFGAEAEAGRSRQLAAYSATPILVAAFGSVAPPVAAIITGLGIVYAVVLLAMGFGRLTPPPDPENNVPRFALTFAVVAGLTFALAAAFISPLISSGREAVSGAVAAVAPERQAPEIARRAPAELAIERLAQAHGAHVLVDPVRLQEQFPDSLPSGFVLQSSATAQGGGVSRADAIYRQGDAVLNLSIIQFAEGVDPAGAAALFDIGEESASPTGYARSQTIDGRLFAEAVDGGNARYIVIGRGVAMIAAGAATVDQGRAAVETIDLRRLEAAFGG